MKKLFSLFITLVGFCAVLCIFSTKAQAATSGDFTYFISDEGAVISDCDESVSGTVVIPLTLGGYPVTGIGAFAFTDCTKIESV